MSKGSAPSTVQLEASCVAEAQQSRDDCNGDVLLLELEYAGMGWANSQHNQDPDRAECAGDAGNANDALANMLKSDAFPCRNFSGQISENPKTANEVYFDSTQDISEELAVARYDARSNRMGANRDLACEDCRLQTR